VRRDQYEAGPDSIQVQEEDMKRIRLYAMLLGLLTCAAAANAQQLKLVDANGKPVTDAQFIAIAEGNKLVKLPPADANGTVDLSSLAGLENVTHKTIEAVVDRCDQDPRTRMYYLLPGQTAPENKEHCKRYRAGAIFWDGSRWVIREGAPAGSPYHFEGQWEKPVSTGAKVEGPSFFNLKGQFSGGLADVPNLANDCFSVPGCSTSNKAYALEGSVGPSFGPFDLQFGFFKTGDVSNTLTETFGTDGETSTETETEKFHVNAFEVLARFNVLGIRAWGDRTINIGPQGGPLVWTVKGTDSFFSSSGGSSSGGSEHFNFGGVTGWWGAHVEVPICGHFSGTLDYKRAVLQHTFAPGDKFSRSMNSFLFGVSVSVTKPTAAFKIR
jgi:hypothetical protein